MNDILNKEIAKILEEHPGGEEFFDALDYMIRNHYNILETFKTFFYDNVSNKSRYGIILSGKFGRVFINNYGKELQNDFSDIIIVNGGIRKGNSVELFRTSLPVENYILLDDSFYSGKTRDEINKVLNSINGRIKYTFVVYDGSINKQQNVFSMFRYYV